ncbi:MAG: hypothetical protein LBI40_00755 [Treponema sp.]|jgi:hypothetical protein|nr:hypothetical protein [Treponema sp.]
MKVLLSIAALAVLTSTVFCGCDDGNSPVSTAPAVENLGRVIIPLPKNHAENIRSVDIETAQTYTNFYEAVFIKDNETLSTTAEAGAGQIEISVAKGVYTILLAAGCKASGLATPLLLASGYVEGQNIDDGENVVKITLKPIAVDIIVDAEVAQGAAFDVRVDIDTKNPFITLAALPLCFNSATNKISSVDFSTSGNVYTWEYEPTAPSTTGEITVFIAHSVDIFPKSSWYIGYYNTTASNTNFKEVRNHYRKIISVIANGDLPKVNLVIEWSD